MTFIVDPFQVSGKSKHVSLFPTLFLTFGPMFFFGSALKICGDMLGLASPQVMKLMIGYVNSYAYSQVIDILFNV